MRSHREYQFSALCHLLNALPLWGLFFCGWIWFALREESRMVVRHAQQAMIFHALLLAALSVWVLLGLLARIMGVLSQNLGDGLLLLNGWIIRLLLAAYIVICLYGSYRCLSRKPFRYPLVKRS